MGSQSICEMHSARSCVICSQHLRSAWLEMHKLSKAFMKPTITLEYKYSQFEVKAILTESEGDDSRPTIVKRHTNEPTFISVLSGKISTIYDLERYL